MSKEPARKSQMTHKNWTLMVAKRLQESYALTLYANMMNGNNDNHINEESTMEPTFDQVKTRSTKFSIRFDNERQAVGIKWGTKTDVRKMKLDAELIVFLVKYYGLKHIDEELTGFTECLVRCSDGSNTIVRCHPYFQSNGPWRDWG